MLIKEYEEEERKRREEALKKIEEETKAAADPEKTADAPSAGSQLVVVDECSMTSLQLFSQLMEALPANARLILIGDKNQLASGESGVVFGEICNFLSRHSPMQLCTLVENHRSGCRRHFPGSSPACHQDTLPDACRGNRTFAD